MLLDQLRFFTQEPVSDRPSCIGQGHPHRRFLDLESLRNLAGRHAVQVRQREDCALPRRQVSEERAHDGDVARGQATFASQIYRLVRVSGGIFKKRAQKLIDKGVIGMSSAKIRKNRMNYYYLTELGERTFQNAFPWKPVTEPMELKGIIETLTEDSWKCTLERRRHNGMKSASPTSNSNPPSNEMDTLTIRKGEQNLDIHLKNSLDRNQSFDPAQNFLLCSSQAVKNLTLQKASRLSAEFGKGFTIFISTVKEFEESGELEEVEFIV